MCGLWFPSYALRVTSPTHFTDFKGAQEKSTFYFTIPKTSNEQLQNSFGTAMEFLRVTSSISKAVYFHACTNEE